MESRKKKFQVIPLLLIGILLHTACNSTPTPILSVATQLSTATAVLPSPEPTITPERDISIAAYCAPKPISEGGTVSDAVLQILTEQGNEIGMYSIEKFLPSGWYVGVGLNGIARIQVADKALATMDIVYVGSTVCIGRNPTAVYDRLVPPTPEPFIPKPGGRLLPPAGRIFAHIQQGFSPSRSV